MYIEVRNLCVINYRNRLCVKLGRRKCKKADKNGKKMEERTNSTRVVCMWFHFISNNFKMCKISITLLLF